MDLMIFLEDISSVRSSIVDPEHFFIGDSISFDLSRIDAAIVDLDGTMVDTVGDFEQALARTLADLGLPPVDRAFITRAARPS
jgi:hypothetical protein